MVRIIYEHSETRQCGECDRLSMGGTCLAGIQARLDQRKRWQCASFVPVSDSYDSRTGRELWPHLVLIGQYSQGYRVADTALQVVASALVSGPKSAGDVIEAGKRSGINTRAIQRAAELLRVLRTRPNFYGNWVWTLREGDTE